MVSSEAKPLPSFEQPPVAEVVCSITFESLSAFLVPYIGLFWQKVKADYPQCKEQIPLSQIIEQFEPAKPPKPQIAEVPSAPRIWFISEDNQRLIQIQRDRFIHNWRKDNPNDPYPRYTNVINMFKKVLNTFDLFLKEENLGEINPLQYELTYVNYIPSGEGWTNLADIGQLLPDFGWRNTKHRFLPIPEGNVWKTAFLLPERLGRLWVTVQKATRIADNKDVIRLDLTVRGIGGEISMDSWFDLAHEWIVRGFTDLTAEEVQREYWRRI